MSLRARLGASPLVGDEKDSLSDLDRLESWLSDGIQKNEALAQKRVVIIGGSFAGLTTALVMHRLGVQVQVYDRVKTLREGGAGIGIEDTSLVCLEALGFGDVLRKSASLPMRRIVHRTNDKELLRSAFPYVSCYWNDIYQMLYEALPENTVTFGKNFDRFEEGEQLTVFFQDGLEVQCDALIGCDGPTSSLRRLLHPQSKLVYRGYTAWRGYLDQNEAPESVVAGLYEYYETLADGAIYFHVGSKESGHLVVYELPANANTGRKINFLWYVAKEQFAEHLGSGRDAGREQRITSFAADHDLNQMWEDACRFWPKPVADFIRAVPNPFMNDIYDLDPLDSWGRGPVTLVGDAGHAVTPHHLKSSNMAICDAVELGLQLARSHDIESAFRAYEDFRKPRATRTVAVSRQLGMVRQCLAPGAPQEIPEWEAMSQERLCELLGDQRVPL